MAHILHPLEIGHRHPAGIRQYIGNEFDAFLLENWIRFDRGRPIGDFQNDFRPDVARIVLDNLVGDSGRRQHIALTR